jgi:hypothetical protein
MLVTGADSSTVKFTVAVCTGPAAAAAAAAVLLPPSACPEPEIVRKGSATRTVLHGKPFLKSKPEKALGAAAAAACRICASQYSAAFFSRLQSIP